MWALIRRDGTKDTTKEIERGDDLRALYEKRDRQNCLAVARFGSLAFRRFGVIPVWEER